MSSFSAKWLSLVVVLSAAATCLLHQPVAGDEALIRTVCGWTPEVPACLSCLEHAVGSQIKDRTELAAISINCASAISDTVIRELSGNAGGAKIVTDAKNTLVDAMLDWSNGQYHSAGDKVANGNDVFSACVKVGAPASNDLTQLKKYYLNAKAILYKL